MIMLKHVHHTPCSPHPHYGGSASSKNKRRNRGALLILFVLSLAVGGASAPTLTVSEPTYTIAFASFAPLNTDIFLADPDGSNPKPLVPHPDLDYNASFSRDGRWIVFTSHRQGSADIYRVHPDGSGLERLTDDPAFDDQAKLSPDGKFLAFVSTRSGQADIWVLELASRRLQNITNHPGGDFRPAWSPDGQWLAFSSDRDSTKPSGPTFPRIIHSTELYLIRPDGSGLRRLTSAQAFAGSPSWSHDASTLVFYEALLTDVGNITAPAPIGLRGSTQIATLELSSNAKRVLTSGPGEKLSPHWLSPDRIAYVSGSSNGGVEFTTGTSGARGEFGSPDWSADGKLMLFHREMDHAQPPLQAWHSRDAHFRLVRTEMFPSYSPSGDRLVCNIAVEIGLNGAVTVMNADGTARAVLFTDPHQTALGPAWSPRGDLIAFGHGIYFRGGEAAGHLAIMRSDGTGLKTLTSGEQNDGFPSWSPDGRRIVFRSAGKTGKDLSIIEVATGEVKRLTDGTHNDNSPAWSPGGDVIAFTSDRNGNFEIYTIRPDGTDLKQLTNMSGSDVHPAWSPDGKWIAFASARGGFRDEAVLHPFDPEPYGDLYVMRADGSEVRQLTDNQYEEGTPTWVPKQ